MNKLKVSMDFPIDGIPISFNFASPPLVPKCFFDRNIVKRAVLKITFLLLLYLLDFMQKSDEIQQRIFKKNLE